MGRSAIVLALCALVACSSPAPAPREDAAFAPDVAVKDASPDAAAKDADGSPDATVVDADAPDADAPDAVAEDAAAQDASADDATAPDASAEDAAAPDASALDAGAPDAFAPDAAPPMLWTPTTTVGAPSARMAASAVWTGSEVLVWGGSAGGPRQSFGDGARYSASADTWRPMSVLGAPSGRSGNVALWTGREMLVWGGYSYPPGEYLGDGAMYDPALDAWRPMSTTFPAPLRRSGALAVWTGREMIVWGGLTSPAFAAASGGRYDPSTDTWELLSTTGAPGRREASAVVWTGAEMIIWGGHDGFAIRNDGVAYDPALDRWRPIATPGFLAPRSGVSAAWTGTEMLVWGGAGALENQAFGDGGRYDPVTDTWRPITGASAPLSRFIEGTAFLAGEMVIWGGSHFDGTRFDDQIPGGLYDPARDRWDTLPRPTFSIASYFHTVTVGDGFAMYWGGGSRAFNETNTGAVLRTPAASDAGVTDSGASDAGASDAANAPDSGFSTAWTPTSSVGAPSPRTGHSAVCTGPEMIIWGGYGPQSTPLNDGARYSIATDRWTPVTSVAAPSARSAHAAVWTGSEMIVWAGSGAAGAVLRDGALYDPLLDRWRPLSDVGRPSPRAHAPIAWTGTEMIVWSGYGAGASGGRYNPSTNAWRGMAMSPLVQRVGAAHDWTGAELVVWAGTDGNATRNTGAAYDPSNDTWRTLSSPPGALLARSGATAVWTGAQVIVWGGSDGTGTNPFGSLDTGASYDPIANTWAMTTTSFGLAPRGGHHAVSLADAMVVWGGFSSNGVQGFDQIPGGVYDPVADRWTQLPRPPYVMGTGGHSFIRCDDVAIAWGGTTSNAIVASGAILRVSR